MTDDIDHLAAAAGMPIPAEYRAGVLRQWQLNQHLAAPLLAFPLPEDVVPAPLFTP